MGAELEIRITADVVCPWCLIGQKRIDDALAARPDVRARVTHRPYLLDPTTPPEGRDLRAWLARKYGVDPARMFARVETEARKSGLPLDFAKVARYPSTLPAHTLVRRAPEEIQHALAGALFRAYFLEERDVGATDVLVELAAAHGLGADAARAWVTDDAELRATREACDEERRSGIDGVPFFVFDGRYVVSGAQEVDTFVKVIDQVLAKRATR